MDNDGAFKEWARKSPEAEVPLKPVLEFRQRELESE
jgi:hypothetical protein